MTLLSRHAGDPAEMRTLLNAKGFVWQDDDDHWTPGIPSLMDYMIERTEPESSNWIESGCAHEWHQQEQIGELGVAHPKHHRPSLLAR